MKLISWNFLTSSERENKEDLKLTPGFCPRYFKYLIWHSMSGVFYSPKGRRREVPDHIIIFWPPEIYPAHVLCMGNECCSFPPDWGALCWMVGKRRFLTLTTYHWPRLLVSTPTMAVLCIFWRFRAASVSAVKCTLNLTNCNGAKQQHPGDIRAVLHAWNAGCESGPQCTCWQDNLSRCNDRYF